MTLKEVYTELKELQKMVWSSDDLMDQETLFAVQDKLADITLNVAVAARQSKDLVKEFPWLYTTTTKGEGA